ncbi:SprB repeat-containing protein, partial [Flavobacterium sp. Fl-318]
TGGSGSFSYLWNTPGNNTTATVSGVPAGTYQVTVKDNTTLCTATSSVTVQSPLVLSLGYGSTAVLCSGQTNGSIDITVGGGTAPYTYAWSTTNGSTVIATNEDQVALKGGTYDVVVTDANGCTLNQSIVVSEPATLTLVENTGAHQQVLCSAGATGGFTVTASGGNAPYLYSIDNFATSNSTGVFSSLTAGSYTVKVKDANDCQGANLTIVITEPSTGLMVNLTKQNATTAQSCSNGSATVTATGGTAPYTYLWSNGGTTATITGLTNGAYSVTVTDTNGCTFTESVVVDCVNTCDAVVTVGTVTNVLCTGTSTGAITVNASSALRPGAVFTFTWSDGTITTGTSSTISNKAAGTYTVGVTINGTVCDAVEESITITEPASMLSASATATDENGPTTSDGTV